MKLKTEKEDIKDADILSGVLGRIERLERAEALLERVFSAIGPYQSGKYVEASLWGEVQDHFYFDDGE